MSTPPSNFTAPEHWAEWFEKCALVLCRNETRDALGKFAHKRYEKLLHKALVEYRISETELPVEAQDLLHSEQRGACWFDLEGSYWYKRKPGNQPDKPQVGHDEAKIYKKFYLEAASAFANAEESRNYLEAKTTENLIWNRCRSIISGSIPRSGGRVDEPGKSQEESIVDNEDAPPDSSIEINEIAHEICGHLTAEVKILLLASENRVTLVNSAISDRLEAKKTTLHKRQTAAWKSLAPLLRKHQLDPGHKPEDIPLVMDCLLGLLTKWALSSECGIGACLTRGEDQT